jgi:heterodisulfide reductase subunit A
MKARVGVYVCECGNNISDQVDIASLVQALEGTPGVVKVMPYRLLCSKEGQELLEDEIRKERLTHLVVAACSPRQHLTTFKEVCVRGGMNPYLMQMANIREQCAWTTPDRQEATDKAARMIRAAIFRVVRQAPLPEREVRTNPDILVVGGGFSGKAIVQSLSGPDRRLHVVDRDPAVADGHLSTMDGVELHSGCELESVRGFFGNFEVTISSGDEKREIKVGAIAICSGSRAMSIQEMGYPGSGDPRVMVMPRYPETLRPRLEALPGSPKVMFVLCAGREKVGYCSGTCCLRTFQVMRWLADNVPTAQLGCLYQDICVPGRDGEKEFQSILGKGARLTWGRLTALSAQGAQMAVSFQREDGSDGQEMADLVVLVPATVPNKGAKGLIDIIGAEGGPAGFIEEGHPMLEPVATSVRGIFLAGSASGPRDERAAMLLSYAAAAQMAAELKPGETMRLEPLTSQVCEALCTGCRNCLNVCTYGAIVYDQVTQACKVNEAICRGCGNCAAACPSDAISVKGATYQQILQEIKEAVK